ncbi:MAG: 5-formyltetrahydrofolate cyclo-ligase, partial [Blastochloris sp.]|nr:5-formyltetrahydrofolate cyclo-ligase [Blastochloris sp.]
LFPRVRGETLDFFQVRRWEDLVPGPWNLLEPGPQSISVDPASLDLILVPGLGYDRRRQRLGRGRGFYDRHLATLPARVQRLGLFFSIQEVIKLPCDEHDQALSAVLTEQGWV